MPELPEVEITRRGIAGIAGARIIGVRQGLPLRWPLGVEPQALTGRTVRSVGRRGKYLLLHLDEGLLLLHLGMSGSLRLLGDAPPPGKHEHFDLHTSAGTLRLHDARRFGAVVYSAALDAPPATHLLGKLGPEPLDDVFDARAFHHALKQHRAPVKQVLLAGRAVVGVGNIYACEALFAAGIHPATPAARISLARAARLHAAIRQVLQSALQQGGSTLRDFVSAQGEAGHFQLHAAVYGRAGQPCPRCARAIAVLRQGQRSTYYCPSCQH